MTPGLTLDAGALIGWQRSEPRIEALLRIALATERPMTIPAAALAEAWRDRRDWQLGELIRGAVVEPIDEALARRAGELCARVPGATAIDALVATSAAQRGDTVVTTDARDLLRLAEQLPSIRVWSA